MPFTLSHPAAILPLLRPLGKRGVMSALAIGSMAPDFEYFLPQLPWRISRLHSHSLWGLLWFCLPAGAIAYVLFHGLLKRPLLALLPPSLSGRMGHLVSRTSIFPKAPWLAVGISLPVGAATHLAWDSFTHEDGWAVLALPWLQIQVATVGVYQIQVFKLLQHGSTVVGLLILAQALRKWLPNQPKTHANGFGKAQRLALGTLLLALPPLIGLLGALRFFHWHPGFSDLRSVVSRSVFTTLPLLSAMLIGYAIAWHFLSRRTEER